LVENAVKHNVVSPKRPLHIWIATTEAGELTVSNTLQKKQSRVLSNGVGLSNIVAKYQMLNLSALAVIETADTFTVSLPLFGEVTA
jgi:LytS/YehU family sensor histidine kinase